MRNLIDDPILRGHLQERILRNVTKVPKGCWIWNLSKDKDGYGYMTVYQAHRKNQRAHRISWMVFWGKEIPVNKVIKHKCDDPRCCNPEHLVLSDNADNMRDRFKTGQYRKGTLTEDQVLELYKLRDSGWTNKQLQKHFGLKESAVRNIYLGKSWSHVFAEYYKGGK